MRRQTTLVITFLVTTCIPVQAQVITEAVPELSCQEYFSSGEMFKAVTQCRDELEINPDSIELQRILAEVEFSAGDPERSVELWQNIVKSPHADVEASRGLAMALWRTGKTADAEARLLATEKAFGDLQTYRDLIGFYHSFNRFDEALAFGIKASKKFPESCGIYEDRGVTQATLGNDSEAATLLAKAVDGGCPPFRWTKRGVLAQRLDNAIYAQLLAPEKLVKEIDTLSDAECRDRLSLLKNTMSVKAAPAVTRVVIDRRTSEVRLAAIGLLSQLGTAALPYWQQVLATDDFILRKHAIRRLRELKDPAFTHLLEECLKMDLTPGNTALTKLTLGEYLLRQGKIERGEAMVLSISEDSNLHGVGLLTLATFYEKAAPAHALKLIEMAREHTPELYIDPDRLEMLRNKTAPE